MDGLRRENRGPVALLILDRPDALNALNGATLESIEARCAELAEDPQARALVLLGRGRAFVAGADIAEMAGQTPLEAERFSRLGQRALDALEGLAIPSIAAVDGHALGGGCELALACDWIYASSRARFGQPEVKLGLTPGFGGTRRLAQRVGGAWAREMILTGEAIDAETALRIGLVNRVLASDELMDTAVRAGEAIAACGPLAVAAAKRVLQQGRDADQLSALLLEQTAFGAIAATRDRDEGLRAFLEKRAPNFEGR